MKPVLIDSPPGQDNSDTQSPLRPGLLVADTYRLVDELGAGSMGAVWKAQHLLLGHGVAIKFLRASLEAYPQGRIRFAREGKLAARLGEDSRHICRVTDFGVLPTGTPFVVMELLQGEELANRLKREPVLPLALTAEIVAQLCRALAVAHRAGVVHRDLKPANVFLCAAEDGQSVFVKLLDFGVAHAALEDDTEGTRQGIVFGTPSYTSPEQISGEAIDARADLWSVAVMAYRMTTGKPPFGAGALHEIGLRILTVEPPAPSSVRPELPPEFDAWMKKALAKQREQRFGSALELAEALHAASLALPSPSAARAGLFAPALRESAARWRRGPRNTVAALLVLGLLALLAAWAAQPSAMQQPQRAARPAQMQRVLEPQRPSAPAPGAPAPVAAEPPSPSGAAAPQAAPDTSQPERAPEAPAAPAQAARRERRRASEAKRRAPAADPLKTRAAELWNKTDEL